jgi:alkanesulfonate monooxygenase SsuD/methylene tetrahydromethanopterin reductase-like flavin-dependent oxidoreductase (luciferase family)
VDLDFSELDPDQRVEHIETDAIQGAVDALTKHAPERDWTVREVAEFCGLGSTSPVIVGSPEQVADELQHWFADVGVDGFNVKEIVRPGTLRDFVDLVVPELRERGLLREEYGDGTLRERMFDRRDPPEGHPAKRE